MNRGLLATPEELSGLRKRVGRKPFDRIYDTLRKRCDLILESAPITETMWRSDWQRGRWGAATAAVASIQGRVMDLIVGHFVDDNTAYRDRAVEELRNLVRFSTWTDPAHADMPADLCTGEACTTVAVALDWLAEKLPDADREAAVDALRRKGLEPYLQGVDQGAFWAGCYHNWNPVVNGGVALGALLLADEDDQARAALATARANLGHFFEALGAEGGWDEGLGYWGYAMRYVLLLGEALFRVQDDESIFGRRGMDATGLFPIYFTPHGTPVSFGDRPAMPACGTFYLLVKHFGLREMTWWLDRYAFRRDVVTSGYSAAGLALLFRPTNRKPEPKPRLQPVKAFHQIGWAAAADQWPTPGMYVALKTGDLAAHHAQLDMNSVQIMVDGEVLLNDPGEPEVTRDYLFSERRYAYYEAQSRAHNTVAAADREHRIDAVGGILEACRKGRARWLVGDAGGALGEDVHFIRHVVLPVDADGHAEMVIILDEIRNVVAEEITASWHTAGHVALDDHRGTVTGAASRLHVAFAADCPLELSLAETAIGPMRMDRTIVVATPNRREVTLLTVFSRSPLETVDLLFTPTCLEAQAGPILVEWEPARRYHRLRRVRGTA